MSAINANLLQVCRSCLAELSSGDTNSDKWAVEDLNKIIPLQMYNNLPFGICRQCKNVVKLIKCFKIQVIKAEAVFKDVYLKLHAGKKVSPKLIADERKKHILPIVDVSNIVDIPSVDKPTDAHIAKKSLRTERNHKGKKNVLPNINVGNSIDVIMSEKDVDTYINEAALKREVLDKGAVNDAPSVTFAAGCVKKLQCPYDGCNSTFMKSSVLKKHLFSKHALQLGPFFCPFERCRHNAKYSKKAFASRSLLKQHYLKVHSERSEKCAKCDERFPTQAMCTRHEKTCSQQLSCQICAAVFQKPESLVSHTMRRHPHEYEEQLERRKMARNGKFSDQFTQTSIKTAPKMNNAVRSTAQTQTFATANGETAAYEPTASKATETPDNSSPFLPFSSIETQTALDELQYSNMQQQLGTDILSELVSLSDIQTQTVWDDSMIADFDFDFDKSNISSMDKEQNPTPPNLLENLTSSPDLTYKNTQTFFNFNDSPKSTQKWM